jgi:hypothetical protein
MSLSAMANAIDAKFTTRSYIQGNDAVTDLDISGGKYVLVMRGDVMDVGMPGVGVFSGQLSQNEEQEIGLVVEEARKYPGFTPAPLIDKYVRSFYSSGDKAARLDAAIGLEPQSNKILIKVLFRNSGREEVCFKSPSTWEGHFNPISGASWVRVSGILQGTDGKKEEQRIQTSEFGGPQMINADEYPKGIVCIPPNQERIAKFLVFPNAIIRKGTYIVGASLVIRDVLEPKEFSQGIEFFSVNKVIDFPRDYPSTPEEIKGFNAYLKSKEQR